MATKKTDQFANIASLQVVESAANTQTSAKFAFPFSIMDKMALIISRIEFFSGGLGAGLNSNGDYCTIALLAAASVTDITKQSDPLVIDSVRYTRFQDAAPTSSWVEVAPYYKDYTSLPGGGILVAPSPLYLAIQGSGCASATSAWIRMLYTYIELSSDEYWQLVESRRIISS